METVWLLLFLFTSFHGSQAAKPNIIVIVADDLGWNDVGFHGSNQIPTPNIDALAYSGIIMNNYYVMPVCTPSRAALMTARHPIHTGMQHDVIFANEPWGLSLKEKLLPQYLKEQGYVTRAVGKWHLGHFQRNYTPMYRSFDSHYGYWGGHQDYYDHTAQDSRRYWGYDMRRNMKVSRKDSLGRYTTNLFTNEAVSVIRKHNTRRPLFMYLAHLAVHSANPYLPLQAPQEEVAKFSHIQDKHRRIFAGMLSLLDQSVGAVVAALDLRGMLQNSIIVFTSDNGGPAGGFNLNAASNWPLRGVKDTIWEGGTRGAAFIWSPLLRNTPRVSTQLAHIQDWLPTLMTAINATLPSEVAAKLDGKDIWAALNDPAKPTYQELLIAIDKERNYAALRRGQWKLLEGTTWNGNYDVVIGPSGREGKYNLSDVFASSAARGIARTTRPLPSDAIITSLRRRATVTCAKEDPSRLCIAKHGKPCLFNIQNDPCESRNVAGMYSSVLTSMLVALKVHAASVVPARNQPADPASNPKYWDYTWTNWCDYPRPPALPRNHTFASTPSVTYV